MVNELDGYQYTSTAQTSNARTTPTTVGIVISSSGSGTNNVCTLTTPSESGNVATIVLTNGKKDNVDLGIPEPPIPPPPPASSCPLLFTYDGNNYEFISDFLGASVLGYRIGNAYGANMYLPIDNDEYLKIDGDKLKEENGKLKLNVNEMLQEVTYLDKLELIAVDRPADTQIYPNEGFNFKDEDLKEYTTKEEAPIAKAKDNTGADITKELTILDKVYAPFENEDVNGFAKDHSYEIDLGNIDKDNSTLFLNGWIQYADSQGISNISEILQAQDKGISIDLPSLEVIGKDGDFKEVTSFMGMPAGLTKTFTYPLQDKDGNSVFETDDCRIRIKTNQKIYYDKIWTATDKGNAKLSNTSLNKANLHYYGFSDFELDSGKEPGKFIYNKKIDKQDFATISGYATKYGDVKPLLENVDDKFVIMTAGDETSLEFNAKNLPKLKEGYKRDYLLYAKGYFKAPRPGRAYGYTIGPLPYEDMLNVEGYQFYPYDKIPNPFTWALQGIVAGKDYDFPASFSSFLKTATDYFKRYTGLSTSNEYPSDQEHEKYRKEYNTRYIKPYYPQGYLDGPDHLNKEGVPLLEEKLEELISKTSYKVNSK